MKVLEIFDQPEAEYLGEAYVAVTPESRPTSLRLQD